MEPTKEDLRVAAAIATKYASAGHFQLAQSDIASAIAGEREKARRGTLEFLQSATEQLGHKDGAMLTIGHLQAQLGMVRPFEEVKRELAIRAADKE